LLSVSSRRVVYRHRRRADKDREDRLRLQQHFWASRASEGPGTGRGAIMARRRLWLISFCRSERGQGRRSRSSHRPGAWKFQVGSRTLRHVPLLPQLRRYVDVAVIDGQTILGPFPIGACLHVSADSGHSRPVRSFDDCNSSWTAPPSTSPFRRFLLSKEWQLVVEL
jgi:hypothetical protein